MDEIKFMSRALDLAKKGLYTARPNPCVGCVIVDPKNNKIISEGYHAICGEDHAEIKALKNINKNNKNNISNNLFNNIPKDIAKGLDCYVTLEPCSHYGRTPPCVKALIHAGVSRVFVACKDPNDLVAGNGVLELQKANIKVKIGILEEEAKAINKGFMHAMSNKISNKMTHKMPYIRCKVATSLDGKVALKNGKSKWITQDQARENGQYLRALSGAVITGVGTINIDDSLMNVRADSWKYYNKNKLDKNIIKLIKQPLRIVIDPRLEINLNSKWLLEPGDKWIITNKNLLNNNNKLEILENKDIYKNLKIKKIIDNKNLKDLFNDLYENQIYDVLVEAGPKLTGYFIENKLLNELWCYQAPIIIGDDGRGFALLSEIKNMQDVISFSRMIESKVLGVDLLRVFAV